MNKASGSDGIPVELFQILKDDAVNVLHSICQQIWQTRCSPHVSQDWHAVPQPQGRLTCPLLSWALKKVGKTFTKNFPWRRANLRSHLVRLYTRHLLMLMAPNKHRSRQLNKPIPLSPWCEFSPLTVLFDEYGVLLRFSRAWGEMLFHLDRKSVV